jgi:lysozyme
MIFGVDVSEFVPAVDWPALAKQGIKFASVRCTRGLKKDKKHDDFTKGARDAGLVTQSYCFDERAVLLADEVDFFIENATLDQLSPCGDFEELMPDKTVPPTAGLRGDAFAERVKAKTGNPSPVLYASRFYWQEMCRQVPTLGGPTGWPWWCADYIHAPTQIVIPGLPYVALQYDGDVTMPGVVGLIDRDVVFAPSLQALAVPGFQVP